MRTGCPERSNKSTHACVLTDFASRKVHSANTASSDALSHALLVSQTKRPVLCVRVLVPVPLSSSS